MIDSCLILTFTCVQQGIYSCLIAQLVKNLPAIQETRWEDPFGEGIGYPLQ